MDSRPLPRKITPLVIGDGENYRVKRGPLSGNYTYVLSPRVGVGIGPFASAAELREWGERHGFKLGSYTILLVEPPSEIEAKVVPIHGRPRTSTDAA